METLMGNAFTADIKIKKDGASISVHSNFRDTDGTLYDLCNRLLAKGMKAEVNSDFGRSSLNIEI